MVLDTARLQWLSAEVEAWATVHHGGDASRPAQSPRGSSLGTLTGKREGEGTRDSSEWCP